MKTTKEVLTTAVELARKHGIAKRQYLSETGAMCINGLLLSAVDGEPFDKSWITYRARMNSVEMLLIIGAVLPHVPNRKEWGWNGLADWNNDSATTPEMVIAALEAAAAAA